MWNVFENRAREEAIKDNWGIGWALIWWGGAFTEEEETPELSVMWGPSKMAIGKPMRQSSWETEPCQSLDLGLSSFQNYEK